jgi:hypothetical protein
MDYQCCTHSELRIDPSRLGRKDPAPRILIREKKSVTWKRGKLPGFEENILCYEELWATPKSLIGSAIIPLQRRNRQQNCMGTYSNLSEQSNCSSRAEKSGGAIEATGGCATCIIARLIMFDLANDRKTLSADGKRRGFLHLHLCNTRDLSRLWGLYSFIGHHRLIVLLS